MTATLSLIGAGRAARTLARLWNESGVFVICDIMNRSRASAEAAAAFIGAGAVVDDAAALRRVDAFMIGTGDGVIEGVAHTLAATPAISDSVVVFHLSGALGSDQLEVLRTCGAAIASAHPLTSFATPTDVLRRFAGTPCAIEGDGRALVLLEDALLRIGANPFRINAARKLHYHAGAVFASNYLVCLIDAAQAAYRLAGIDGEQALVLARPLIEQTLANILANGPSDALSGPIARGDVRLVRMQYAALHEADPALARLYRDLGQRAASIAQRPDPFVSGDEDPAST